jgi:hypothetical protein
MKNILFLMTLLIPLTSCQFIPSDKKVNSTPEEYFTEKIKQATLLMKIASIKPDKISVGYSIGTVVKYREEIYLVTHNHYDDLLDDMNIVEFRDNKNHKIKQIYAFDLKKWIVYQDPGTLVLRAPDFLADTLNPVKLEPQPQWEPGDTVQVAHRGGPNRDKVEILEAVIEEISTYKSTPVYRFRSLDGQEIAQGDSGGGVWFNGALIANNWAIITKSSITTTSGNHNSALQIQTNLSIAAVLPELIFSLDGTTY